MDHAGHVACHLNQGQDIDSGYRSARPRGSTAAKLSPYGVLVDKLRESESDPKLADPGYREAAGPEHVGAYVSAFRPVIMW